MLRLDRSQVDERETVPDGKLLSFGENEERIFYGGDIMKSSQEVLDEKTDIGLSE